jgi:hypothetical protein
MAARFRTESFGARWRSVDVNEIAPAPVEAEPTRH